MHPALAILTAPRKTMRTLLEAESSRAVIILPAIIGLLSAPKIALSALAFKSVTADYTLHIWAAAILLSVLSFWMYVSVYGAVYRWIASWFGGTATNQDARRALAWTQIPFILIALIYLPIQVIFREGLYPEIDTNSIEAMITSLEHASSYAWIGTLFLIPNLLAYILSLKLLAEACRFSAWKAFAVKIIALLLHIPLFFLCALIALPISLAYLFLTA